MTKPKISILVSARKNSKYLNKFLLGYFNNTKDPFNYEILIMLNEGDTWNNDLVEYFQMPEVRFYREDLGLGRAGLHEYYNLLAEQASGDWLIYFCEDHFINAPTLAEDETHAQYWDEYFLAQIELLQMDPKGLYMLVPKFDNAGAMNHMISRGLYEAMGNSVGRHGWIDSYLNDVGAHVWGKGLQNIIRMDRETFHDFTHDVPGPMDDSQMQSVLSDAAAGLPNHGSAQYQQLVEDDAARIRKAQNEL